jgi:hypothetical protein
MRPQQTVAEMAEDALSRQSSAHAQRTGQSLAKALEAVLKTPAGRQLEELGSGAHQHEEARDWQENLLWERTLERLEGMATSDTVRRFATERHYSWGLRATWSGLEARRHAPNTTRFWRRSSLA